jgi:hypothetical protein
MSLPALVNSAACTPGSLTRDFISGRYKIVISLGKLHGRGLALIATNTIVKHWCIDVTVLWEASAEIFERKNDGK